MSESEPTPETKTEIIAPQIEEGMNDQERAILALNTRLENLENYMQKGLGEQVTTLVKTSLQPVVEAIAKRFEQTEQLITATKPTGGGNPIVDLFKTIFENLDKIPGLRGGGGGSFAQEAESTMQEIIKLDLKDMLMSRRKQSGLPAPHVVIES